MFCWKSSRVLSFVEDYSFTPDALEGGESVKRVLIEGIWFAYTVANYERP